MSDEEFKAVSPFDKKSCYDCKYLKRALSHWCRNPEAIAARGTSIPGCIKCPYWEPNWRYIEDKYKTEENGYKPKAEEAKEKAKKLKKWYLRKLIEIFGR